jgi:hypothetical protein
MAECNPITPLLELYKENTIHGRQHETQRQLVTGAVVALAAALISAMASLRFHPATFPLGIFVAVSGVLGRRFSRKFYERFRYHMAMAYEFRAQIDLKCPDAGIGNCRQEAKKKHSGAFPSQNKKDHKDHLNRLWLTLDRSVMWLGIGCTTLVFINWGFLVIYGKYLIPDGK